MSHGVGCHSLMGGGRAEGAGAGMWEVPDSQFTGKVLRTRLLLWEQEQILAESWVLTTTDTHRMSQALVFKSMKIGDQKPCALALGSLEESLSWGFQCVCDLLREQERTEEESKPSCHFGQGLA